MTDKDLVQCIIDSGRENILGPVKDLIAERDALKAKVEELAAAAATVLVQPPPTGAPS